MVEGKTMGPYQESYRIALDGEGPWDVTVGRLTPDSNAATEQNTLSFDSYTELVDLALTYPRTALVGVHLDGELFGGNIPSRAYDYKGWVVRVPTNYDAANRLYLSAFWDGTFKRSWSDDPAWLYYHLLTHPSGAGLADSQVDKWALYEISRYASERVPDGFGGFEPRFSANFVLSTRTEAYGVINALASSMRAMTYWSAGAVSIVADMPRDPEVLVSQADTIDGFEYTGASLKARHTVALVSYLDRENLYETAIETVEDGPGIERYGWNPVEINAFACTSRGQAHRLGLWTLDTERTQSEGLGYKCSVNHLNVQPGAVAAVADPDYANLRAGGKVIDATSTTVRLDAPVSVQAGHAYKVMVTLPNGTVETRNVTSGPGTHASLAVTPPFSAPPHPESAWIVTSTFLAPRQFKVLGITEDSPLEFNVAAILHDPTKYARVEQGVQFERPPFTRLPNPGVVAPPADVAVSREYIGTPTGFTDALQVSWTASPDAYLRGYVVRWQKNLGPWQALPEAPGTSATIYGEGPGSYVFHVHAVNFAGVQSPPAILRVDILNESPITLLRPSGLELEGQGADTVFQGRDPVFSWRATAIRGAYPLGQEPAAGAGFLDAIFRDFEVRVLDAANRLVFTDHTTEMRYAFSFEKNAKTLGGPHRAFKFVVLMRDKWGNFSRPAELEVSNPAPAQPTNLAVLPGVGSIFVKYDRPADLDYAGTLVWVGETTNFAPGPANLVYEGDSTFASAPAQPNSVRFVRVAAYDSFGKTGLNVSAEVRVVIGGVSDPDFLPPAVPTGLRLSTSAAQAPDGTWTYRLRAEWDESADGDFVFFKVAISENNGNFVFFTAPEGRQEWAVQAGSTYTVKLAAVDSSSNASVYSAEQRITIAGLGNGPADPTAMTIVSSMRTVWLQWPQHPAPDFGYMEIWEGTENDRTTAVHLHNATGTTFPRDGLAGGQVRYYWIRAVNRSRIASPGFFPTSPFDGVRAEVGKLTENDFPLLVVKDAFIDEIDARKIRAGSVISGEVRVEGTGLDLKGLTEANGGDPAAAINTGSTLLQPGKVVISGGTTLADWRHAGDQTRIDGGNLAANSVRANHLAIGNRNVEFTGLAFTAVKETNTATWTSGSIDYVGDAGAVVNEAVAAGSAQWTGSVLYLYWKRGQGNLAATAAASIHADPDAIVLGSYTGEARLFVNYGQTVIDGTSIRANTVSADRLQANSITARELSAGTLITSNAQIGQAVVNEANIVSSATLDAYIRNLSADKIRGGAITGQYLQVGGNLPGREPHIGAIFIEGRNGNANISFFDRGEKVRVHIGQWGNGSGDRALDGLYVRDVNGNDILTANGLGVAIVGTGNIGPSAVTGMAVSEVPSVGIAVTTPGAAVVCTAHCRWPNTADAGFATGMNFRLAYRINGVHLDARLINIVSVGGTVTAFTVAMLVRNPPVGPVEFRMELGGGTNWAYVGNNITASLVAQEFKK
jgi:predicted phage tail protein